jgi:hypothetical protein
MVERSDMSLGSASHLDGAVQTALDLPLRSLTYLVLSSFPAGRQPLSFFPFAPVLQRACIRIAVMLRR